MNVQLKVLDQRLGKVWPLPSRATAGAAGIDLRALLSSDALVIFPGQRVKVSTGLAVYIGDPNVAMMLLPRSGWGSNKGLVPGNLVGTVDSDYQGEIVLSLWNSSLEPVVIQDGDRVAQAVFIPVVHPAFLVVSEFTEPTARGESGFGHTGN